MKPVKATAEILAFKALNWDINKTWTDWAVDMLMAGYDTEHLTILAGESEPFNQFEMQELAEKVLTELKLDYSDKDQIIKSYACYLIDKSLNGELDNVKVLDILKDICIELDYEKYLYDFYSLFFAKDDLSYSENQWYWDGATRENIDKIITDYFRNWKNNCLTDDQTTMNWTDLKNKIYYWDGSWRDIYVLQTTRANWKIWVDYVNKNYRIDWFNGKSEKDENQIDFAVIEEFWSGNHDLCSTAKVFIDKIQINVHFFDDTEMENDIDPREFNSIDDHYKLIKYMSDLSTLLGKEAILTPENEHETILFKVNKGIVEFSEDIDPTKWKLRTR